MSYTHIGKVLDNGLVNTNAIITNSPELDVKPENDGLHISDFNIGDFEWWYFDVLDNDLDCYLKIVIHIGTDPLKTKIYPQLALSINTPEISESYTRNYKLKDIEIDTQKCDISISNEISVLLNDYSPLSYYIKIKTTAFYCDLKFTSELEGWKPLGDEVKHQIGKKKGVFAWTIPMPKARVEGVFSYKNKKQVLQNAIGYHDHNYNKIDKKHPLHLDELVTKWYWGKCYAEPYTLIFMDTRCNTNRTLSLLVAKENKIIYSSNNRIICKIVKHAYDNKLKVDYPISIQINTQDNNFVLNASFEKDKILDSRDLLECVNSLFSWVIKKWIARPAYYGILAKVQLHIGNQYLPGFGNFETMVFRNK